ncbi:MAG: WD40 repeat domain-containing protein, partial [Anaerolineae bacterium]|nr:WD40 repeat domain-containing protein [Anaerolineae bacterium]
MITVWQFKTKTFWGAAGWKEAATLTGHTFGVEVIKPVPGKAFIITGDRNGVMQVWDTTDWQLIASLKVNGTLCNSVTISPDGLCLAAIETVAVYLHTTVKIWATATWQEIAQVTVESPTPVSSLAFTADSKYLLAGGSGLFVIHTSNWQVGLHVPGAGDVRTIAVFPDGKHVLAGVNIWKLDWGNLCK